MPRLSTQWLAVGMAAMAGATAYPLAASAGGHQGKGPEVLGCADLAAAILDNQGNDLFEDVFPGKGQDAFPGKGRDAGPRSRVLAATSVLVPAGTEPPPFPGGPPGAPYPAHCEVNLTMPQFEPLPYSSRYNTQRLLGQAGKIIIRIQFC